MESNILQLLFFLLVAGIASTAGAISGIGGGIIIKPVLDAVSGYGVKEISFMSGCTVLAMSFVSLLRGKSGIRLDKRRGTALASGAALGGMGGKFLFNAALNSLGGTPALIGIIQSVILTFLTFLVFLYVQKKNRIVAKNIQNIFFCIGLGLILGTVSAFLGIGGGPINTMAISYFLSMDSKTVALHSLYTIFISQAASLLLEWGGKTAPTVSALYLAAMVSGGITGGLIGLRVMKTIGNDLIDRIFSVVLWVVMLLTAFNAIQFTISIM
ncbi:UPF0721 transmembrane protein [Spirochaetia bacterium]|nr:UPF0721 transmembrane protein [Spirochaetia bacterium]